MASISRASSLNFYDGGNDRLEQNMMPNARNQELLELRRFGSYASAKTLKSKFNTNPKKSKKKQKGLSRLFCGLDRVLHRRTPTPPEDDIIFTIYQTSLETEGKSTLQKAREISGFVDNKESGYSTIPITHACDQSADQSPGDSVVTDSWYGARPKIKPASKSCQTTTEHPQLLRKITEADSFGSSRDSIVSAIEQEDDHLSIQYQSQEEFLRQQQVPEDVYMVSVGTQCTPIPPPRKFGIAHQTPTAQFLHQSEVLAQLTAKMQAMQAYILLIAPHTQQQVAHCQTAPVVQRLSAKSRRASWANNAQRNSWVNSEHRISEILREYPSQLQENIQAGVRKCSTCSQRSTQRRSKSSRKPNWLRELEERQSLGGLNDLTAPNSCIPSLENPTNHQNVPRLTFTPSSPTSSTSNFTRGAISALDDWSSTHSDETQWQPISASSVQTMQGADMVTDYNGYVTGGTGGDNFAQD